MAKVRETTAEIDELLDGVRTVAVLGIKTAEQADQPAYYVPAYVQQAGLTIIPVPVYYPEATEILGVPVVRSLAEIAGDIDLVDVFRRSADLRNHEVELVARRPRAVWFQSGIRNDAVAARLVAAGIDVVQDRCLMVELKRRGR